MSEADPTRAEAPAPDPAMAGQRPSPTLPNESPDTGRLDALTRGVDAAAQFRRGVGYFASGLAGVSIFLFLYRAFDDLPKFEGLVLDDPEAADLAVAERVFYARVGIHGFITIASVWFCYQLLRYGERLAKPLWQKVDDEGAVATDAATAALGRAVETILNALVKRK